MWKIYLIKQLPEDYKGKSEFNNVQEAMDTIEFIYESYKDAHWDDDLQYVYPVEHPDLGEVDLVFLAYVENVKDNDLPVQNLLFDNIEEPESTSRFSQFKDSELWLLYNVLNTTVGASNISSYKLIREIMWEQKMRYANNITE